jgi:hypothetical protein
MKKLVVVLFSISLLALITTTKEVKQSPSTNDAAYATSGPTYHPIQPPIG